jgi:hypothetical protein
MADDRRFRFLRRWFSGSHNCAFCPLTISIRIIGGGVAVGTLTLIEEDIYSEYSQTLLKYFLGEGVACKQTLYVACDHDDPKDFIQKLPYLSGSSKRAKESKESNVRRCCLSLLHDNILTEFPV